MKSKQVNFYINHRDLAAIDEFLKEENCLIFKRRIDDLQNIPNYDIVSNTESIFQVYLCKEEFQNIQITTFLKTVSIELKKIMRYKYKEAQNLLLLKKG